MNEYRFVERIWARSHRSRDPAIITQVGAVRVSVSNNIVLNGEILAHGGAGSGGGGAGGSIFVSAAELSGGGVLRANGGSGSQWGGGGGGGRISLILDTGGAVTQSAYGGPSSHSQVGAAGTIYIKLVAQSHGTLLIDNAGQDLNRRTRISTDTTDAIAGDVIVRNNGALAIDTDQSLSVYGSWSNAATFSSLSGGTVAFAGADDATVWGDNAWENLTIATSGKTVRFEAGKTQTVNGTPTFDNGVTFLSTEVTQGQWKLTVPIDGENDTQPVGRVSARDSDASAGRTILPQGGVDLGNNVNRIFPAPGSLILLR